MKRKGALDLGIGTMVIIVIAVVLLVLALVFVQRIFEKDSNNQKLQDKVLDVKSVVFELSIENKPLEQKMEGIDVTGNLYRNGIWIEEFDLNRKNITFDVEKYGEGYYNLDIVKEFDFVYGGKEYKNIRVYFFLKDNKDRITFKIDSKPGIWEFENNFCYFSKMEEIICEEKYK